MNENLKDCLCQAKYQPEDDLAEKVWNKLLARNKRIALEKFWIFSFAGFVSAVVSIPVFAKLLSDFSSSGFYEYFSLAFSTNGAITSYWKEFILSLAESLPIMSTILSLGIVLVFFISIRYAMKQIIKGQLTLTSFRDTN